MADALTIVDLIGNGTLSAEVAATLWAAMDERKSILVTAIPRLAGKTTTINAILDLLPSDVPVHRLSGAEEEMRRLKQQAIGGYVVIAEISQASVPAYLWGQPVRTAFDTLKAGYSLAVTLHAADLQESFDVICRENGVPEEDASRIDYAVYIQRFGTNLDDFQRRVSELHEVDRVEGGKVLGRQLFRWDSETDTFETLVHPTLLSATPQEVAERASYLRSLVHDGRRSTGEVAQALAQFTR